MRAIYAFLFVCLFTSLLAAQDFRTPRPSPNASLKQTVGVTDIEIHYSRPGVKNRTIWGELVPYGKVWRTGANEVTSITFSDAVTINGKELPAGTYGIHTIPSENDWTVILSKSSIGGSSNFDEANEVHRFTVKPEQIPMQERLQFTITDLTDDAAMVNMEWEKLKVSFKVEVPTQQLVLAKADKAVDWATPMNAATYCLQNGVNLDKAMDWINASTLINENYWNLRIKARLLDKTGKRAEAAEVMAKAVEMGEKMPSKPFDLDASKKTLNELKAN